MSRPNLILPAHARGVAISLALALLFFTTACDRDRVAPPSEVTVAPAAGPEAQGTVAQKAAAPETVATDAAGQAAPASLAPAATPLPPATPLPTPTPPSGALTVWHSWAQRDGDALETILRQFSEQYPGVQVDTLFVAQDDLLQSYAQAVAGGSGPDVVLAPNWWLHDLYAANAVATIGEASPGSALDEVWPAAVDNLRIDGQLYGIPTNYETVALFYNRALAPDTELPQSLDELAAMARQDPSRGIGLYASPFHLAWGFPAFGASLFDESGKAILDQSDGTAAFLGWLSEIDALEGSYVDSDYGMLLDRFKRGEYAFFVDGPWAIPELSEALGLDLGVTAIPAGPAGDARPWLYADAAYVRPGLPKQQAALAGLFAAHVAGAASGSVLAREAGRLPTSQSADLGADPLLRGFAAQAALADGMAHGPQMDAFWRYGGDMLLRALAGSEELQTVVVETAELTNEAAGK